MSNKDATGSRSLRLLGHSFEVRSPLSSGKAKAALRQHKQGWLNAKTGPRGWIVGSLLCLQWGSIGDRGAPLLLARIADDGFGSRVHGRAGLDLASLGIIGFIAGVLIFSVYSFVSKTWDLGTSLFFCAIILIPGAVLWLRVAFHGDADPLVRFIRRVLEPSTVPSTQNASPQFDRTPVQSAKLNVNGHEVGVPPSEYDVAQAVLAMKPDGFLIIDFGSNTFMQTALEYDRFVLEKCEGSHLGLYRAQGDFEADDVIAVMSAYLRGSEPSKQISWKKVRG